MQSLLWQLNRAAIYIVTVHLLKTLLGLVTCQGGICLQAEKFLEILEHFIQQQLVAESVVNTWDFGKQMVLMHEKLSKY